MSILWEQHPLIVVVFLFFSLMTAYSNLRIVRRFDEYTHPPDFPRVSVLVPARDEAHNIEACVRSLLAQDYPDFEVLVLDDHSVDETRSILEKLAREDYRLHVLDGGPLPLDWLGKHWACDQLARRSTGELLLFTDADTRHSPNMLRDSVAALIAEQADVVTAFPREEVVTWGERLVVPIMGWGILSFLPLWLAYRLSKPGFSVTIGQFMLFRRSAFEDIGGYKSVRQHLVDDVALGRRILAEGYRWRLLDGTAHVCCRMYRGFWEAVEGFSKNIFAFFEYRILLYLLAWSWIAIVFLEPPFTLFSWYLGMSLSQFPPGIAAIAVGQSLILWRIAYKRFHFPGYLVFLYPISVFLFVLIAMRSMVLTLTGHATWKGRNLVKPAMRWL
ncbi:MAG: glycosyltransferase [Chloroflexota bacterium]